MDLIAAALLKPLQQTPLRSDYTMIKFYVWDLIQSGASVRPKQKLQFHKVMVIKAQIFPQQLKCNDSRWGQKPGVQASLLSGKIFSPSSTNAPSNIVHSGMHTNVSFTSASFSSLAHSVRQKPSFSSMAVRYQARRRRSGEPLRGS